MKWWRNLPLRTKTLILVLILMGVAYVFVQVQTGLLQSELDGFAQEGIQGIHDGDNDVAYEVTVAKHYVLFGETQGKVEVFVRPKSPRSDGRIHSVSLYYNRQGGAWTYDGSGASADEESHQKGLRVFARRNPTALQQ